MVSKKIMRFLNDVLLWAYIIFLAYIIYTVIKMIFFKTVN